MKINEFKKQLIGLTGPELRVKARGIYSQISKSRLELRAGKLPNKRAVFNLRKQLAIIKSKNL